jgi:hypothetical protein
VLFVLLDEKTNRTGLDILDTLSGRITKIEDEVDSATWSSDGKQLLYIARVNGRPVGAVRAYDRVTATERELVAPFNASTDRPSIVSVAY